MGSFPSKRRSNDHYNVKSLSDKIRVLKEEIKEMINEREKESVSYEREVMLFAFKEGEWKHERKRLREEINGLKKSNLELQEEKFSKEADYDYEIETGLINVNFVVEEKKKKCEKNGWELLGTSFLLEQMREERARRDEAVEKWKQLYLTIKTELDHLIQTTNGDRGHGRVFWRTEEEEEEERMVMEELKRELKEKVEKNEALKAELAIAQREIYKRERQIDILKQSFKIMTYNRKTLPLAKT